MLANCENQGKKGSEKKEAIACPSDSEQNQELVLGIDRIA